MKLRILVASLLIAGVAHAETLCINARGKLKIQESCSGDWKPATAKGIVGSVPSRMVVGPQGPAGKFNVDSCRKVSTYQSTSNGIAHSALSCGQNEFLLNHSIATYDQDGPSTLAFQRSEELTYSGPAPTGVYVRVSTEINTFAMGEGYVYNTFTLFVDGTCCPR